MIQNVSGTVLSVTPRETRQHKPFYITKVLIGDEVGEIFSFEQPTVKGGEKVAVSLSINLTEKKVSCNFPRN